MSPFRQVIFDCDGVLVDSERISARVLTQMMGELGLSLSQQDIYEHFVGLSMSQCLSHIGDMLGRTPPPGLVQEYDRRTHAALESEVAPVPGIFEALERITLPGCVASNGEHAKMRVTLTATGLWPRFQGRVFSADDVDRPKPAPDVYLLAATHSGVAPADCVVVEDTPTGVAAARAAGMTVLGFGALTPAHRLREAGAHAIFDDMRALPGLIDGGRPVTGTSAQGDSCR